MGRRAGLPSVYLPPGKHVYMCSFTVAEKRTRVSTGERDYGRAVEAAAKLHAEAQLGRRTPRRVRVRHSDQATLAVLAADYLEYVEASGLSQSYYLAQGKHFKAHFLERWPRLSDITEQAIERYPASRAREITPRGKPPSSVTIYKELVTLSRFLLWCGRQGHIAEVPRIARVKPVSDYKPVDLSADEVARVLAFLPTRKTHRKRYAVRERYTVQWGQGLRDGDVATLRWSDVDLTKKTLTIRQSNDKARQGRTVELAEKPLAVLVEMSEAPHVPDGLIFGAADLSKTLTKACKAAGVTRITTHGFRHARLSELGSVSSDVAAIQFIAGHANLATTDKYVRSRTARTGAVFAAADSVIPKKIDVRKRESSRRRQRS